VNKNGFSLLDLFLSFTQPVIQSTTIVLVLIGLE